MPTQASSRIAPPDPSAASLLPGITLAGGFRFRSGQQTFLEALAEALRHGETSHLGVFVPGYGKTITALASFVVAHALGAADRLVVFVPRGNLRDQYADPAELSFVFRSLGAPPFSFCVADSERVFLKNLGTQIIITTYQYASGDGGHAALRRYCAQGRPMFVFDEVHHLAEDGLWASKIEDLDCACSVALSGTPMRSDNKTLFGVPFEVREDGEQYYVALHEVTMRDAYAEGRILKQVETHVVDYRLRMVREDTGDEVELSLSGLQEVAKTSKEVDVYLARRKLRFHEVYLETLLGPAFDRFAEKRRSLVQRLSASGRAAKGPFRNHQMLVIAMSNRHAAAILDFVRRRFPGFRAARIGQDLPGRECETLLDAYRAGDVDVMVQVDMIGEGTDIKPISVIVKADLVRALSKTMQQVFRGMRYYADFPEPENVCDIYAANDSEIVNTLNWISAEEQVGVKIKDESGRSNGAPPGAPSERSAWELKHVEQHGRRTHTLDLFHQPPPRQPEPPPSHAVDLGQRERDLRKECATLAAELAHALEARGIRTSIRSVHAAAKKRLGGAQSDLSVGELERKKRWLERCIRARRLL